ncbi:MAG: GNAT family N-acetyltransferase [Microbacterium sp.]|uniref:GNAT family N-acetyltransferase n=1 Tax=Microbacterium sp. TaxID=51671 RepID=UPI00092CC23B|nr:GNAT family N-acetyltransferase [Microbacterium sp.]MBN9192598.1 GNAT family N-acetyltransferase [Microbacterium sp.]MBN9195744.1 GNAT family N-acetyltransferase [Microbacterium sp.]OJU67376.1 MAG: PadR family transcriptional regulator [Microbacterium sp. 70-38]
MVSVRPTAADSTEARQLLAEYFGMRAATFPGAYTPVFPAPESFDPPAGVFLIVADEGELAGCGGIRRIPDGPRGIRYEVKHLFLRPATRGRGWGRLLLDELERHAREWGAGDLVLDTHHTLEAAAGLYASAGFVPVEAYNDNPNATRWYAKPLCAD